MYGMDALDNPNYGKIINKKHYQRLTHILDGEKILFGGERNHETLQIAPTVVGPVSPDGPAMGEELFGPILPVLPYQKLEEAIAFVRERPKPLAAVSVLAKHRKPSNECRRKLQLWGRLHQRYHHSFGDFRNGFWRRRHERDGKLSWEIWV